MDTYTTLGYERCNTGYFNKAFGNIVIFADAAGVPTHAARQLKSGKWTSTWEPNVDIEHGTPDALNGPDYGARALVMRRPRPLWRWPIAAFTRTVTPLFVSLRKLFA